MPGPPPPTAGCPLAWPTAGHLRPVQAAPQPREQNRGMCTMRPSRSSFWNSTRYLIIRAGTQLRGEPGNCPQLRMTHYRSSKDTQREPTAWLLHGGRPHAGPGEPSREPCQRPPLTGAAGAASRTESSPKDHYTWKYSCFSNAPQ